MARSAHPTEVSPLISGGIFSQRIRRSRVKAEPTSAEVIRDYGELLEGLNRAFTEVTDHAYPNADFLTRDHVDGSDIKEDTKLSFVVRSCLGISQMTLKPELVKNYQQTLKKHLKKIQHQSEKKAEYTELLNIVKTYQNLSNTIVNQEQIHKELHRLSALKLPSKTIDRRLQKEWIEPAIQKPILELTAQVAKTMRSSKQLQSEKLAGSNNSLAGLSRLVTTSNTAKTKHRETQEEQSYQNIAAPAA